MTSTLPTGDGTIIGFSGRNWASAAINIATWGIPFYGLSHVGICSDGKVYEALCDKGFQANDLDSVRNYNGNVWAYELTAPLYSHQSARLKKFLNGHIGKSYDALGAFRAAGIGWSTIESWLRPTNLESLFCSEICAAALSHIDKYPTNFASRYSPNRLVRALRRAGILAAPIRIK